MGGFWKWVSQGATKLAIWAASDPDHLDLVIRAAKAARQARKPPKEAPLP